MATFYSSAVILMERFGVNGSWADNGVTECVVGREREAATLKERKVWMNDANVQGVNSIGLTSDKWLSAINRQNIQDVVM